ncbi:MAG: ion transporter [Deltaproteobacteria bacterium]|nr:ion transporter [Deltaproteobacteria bacterium]
MILTIFIRKLITNRKLRLTVTAAMSLVVVLLISTVGIWFLESDQNLTLLESFWLSIVTMTTVGYGDICAKTTAGRLFIALVTMLGGIGVMAYLVSLLATHVIEREINYMNGQVALKFQGHILIINCPNEEKVHAIIDELRVDNRSYEVPIVLISDDFETCPEQLMRRKNFYFVQGNPMLMRVLERANAYEASQAVILAKDPKDGHSDGLTTQVALVLESMRRKTGKKIYVVAEAVNRDSIEPLMTAGVDDVLCLENIVPPVLVQAILDPGVPAIISDLSTKLTEGQIYVSPVPTFKNRTTYGMMVEHLFAKSYSRIIPIGLIRKGRPIVNPPSSVEIQNSDRLAYIADKRRDLDEIFAKLNR